MKLIDRSDYLNKITSVIGTPDNTITLPKSVTKLVRFVFIWTKKLQL